MNREQEALTINIRSKAAPARVGAVACGLAVRRLTPRFAGIDAWLSKNRGAPLPNIRSCSQFERVNVPATGSNPAALPDTQRQSTRFPLPFPRSTARYGPLVRPNGYACSGLCSVGLRFCRE